MDNSKGKKSPPDTHYRHRLPAETFCHSVWLYHVFLKIEDQFDLPAGAGDHPRSLESVSGPTLSWRDTAG